MVRKWQKTIASNLDSNGLSVRNGQHPTLAYESALEALQKVTLSYITQTT
jgi:hypothetical protein